MPHGKQNKTDLKSCACQQTWQTSPQETPTIHDHPLPSITFRHHPSRQLPPPRGTQRLEAHKGPFENEDSLAAVPLHRTKAYDIWPNEAISDASWLSCSSLAHDIWMSGSYLNLLWLMVSPCSLHTVTGLQKCAARLLCLLLCQVGSLFCCYACCLPATPEHLRLNFHVLPRTQKWKESMNSHGKQKQVTFWQHPWQATQSPDAARIGQGDSEACPLQHIFFEGNSVHDHHLSPFITDHHPLPSMTVRDQPRPSMNIQQEAKTEGLWKNTIMKWQFARCNVGSWLVWDPPLPPHNIWTLFKVESQNFSSQEKSKSSLK